MKYVSFTGPSDTLIEFEKALNQGKFPNLCDNYCTSIAGACLENYPNSIDFDGDEWKECKKFLIEHKVPFSIKDVPEYRNDENQHLGC